MGIKSTLGKSVSKALEVFRSKDLTATTPPDTGAALNNQIDSKHIRMQPLSGFLITGGTVTEPGNGYRYAYFSAPGGTLTVQGAPVSIGSSVMVDILVVAGGGGGGNYYGSGGGAGGVAVASSISIGNGDYTIGVGTGGMGGSPTGGYSGSSTAQPSYFGAPGVQVWPGQPDHIEAKGGGQGVNGFTTQGNTGGSGSGSGGGDPSPAAGEATQPGTNPSPAVDDYGQPGGFSEPTGGYAPAGGGGAYGAGGPAPMNNRGGGDGGGGDANGIGGAPNPNPSTGPGQPGIDLLGGGGGGSKTNNNSSDPPQLTMGMGGDGIVIVKYPATGLN